MNRHQGQHVLRLLCFVAFFTGCSATEESTLERVIRTGELRVLTYEGSTTYYETPEGPAGFEHDLAQAFAEYLGVRLQVVVASGHTDVLPRLKNGDADFAAAGLVSAQIDPEYFRSTQPYQLVKQQFIYRMGGIPPRSLHELSTHEVEVAGATAAVTHLTELKQSYRQLNWSQTSDKSTEEMLQLVWEGLVDLTVADSNTVTVNRQYFPELQVAFEMPKPDALAWAFDKSADASLHSVATKFLKGQSTKTLLAQLNDRYYGPAARSNYINLAAYRLRIHNRLPEYQQYMEAAAKKHGLDWRLVAAVGYQESYWDPSSVSPTGVRGFMMLTQDTAAEVGVLNREDPATSIEGGARYLRRLLNRLPPRIKSPDRQWFALAAYNVGLGHVEDARKLTQTQGGNPDLWNDVKQRLPLLSDPRWHTQTRYGHARGEEPVRFVNRVRTYYDVLARMDEEEKNRRVTQALKLKAPAI